MSLKCATYKHTLNFKFDAGTSRGVFKKKDSWYIKIWEESSPECFGIGEAAPLPNLSLDDLDNFDEIISNFKIHLNRSKISIDELKESLKHSFTNLPSLRFALETAIYDIKNGGIRKIFDNDFFNKKSAIEINGLIWMGDAHFMKSQIQEKLKLGYKTLKMKIGALDFELEMAILKEIRKKYSKSELELRVDANGAFVIEEAKTKLAKLAELDIHSIEQPIKAGQKLDMAELCKTTNIPIALDEELIGIDTDEMALLLNTINPQYLILKPTLLGGFDLCDRWIEAAEERGIGWWMTSALESNIGLNAICQYTYHKKNSLPQGLGTGQLYHNNIGSPLQIQNGYISLNSKEIWDLSSLKFTS